MCLGPPRQPSAGLSSGGHLFEDGSGGTGPSEGRPAHRRGNSAVSADIRAWQGNTRMVGNPDRRVGWCDEAV